MEGDRTWTYAELRDTVAVLASQLPGRELCVVECRPDVASAIAYLGAAAAGHAVLLLEAEADNTAVLERYRPRYVLTGRALSVDEDAPPAALHPELRVLLSTSGSTGSPKLVRLTEAAVLANARSIATYLELGPGERAIASLPIQYSYGLSVLNSHLIAGATVAFTAHSIIRPEFWDDVRRHACTSFAAVPYGYAMLERIGFRDLELPALRTMTQAGGRLDPDVVRTYARHVPRFFVMYGQTEATARISYVPHERVLEKAETIGVPVPGGELSLSGDGELVYAGPNVMLGYAERREDLALGDVLGGVLATGDLGAVDDEGFFSVVGRRRRIAKVYGLRINLDEVEAAVGAPAAAVADGERIVVYAEHGADARALAQRLRLPPRAITTVAVDALPLTARGKVDYEALRG